jgi:hypothetical protein
MVLFDDLCKSGVWLGVGLKKQLKKDMCLKKIELIVFGLIVT